MFPYESCRMDGAADRPYSEVAGETWNNGGAAASMFMVAVVSGIVGLASGLSGVGLVADAVTVASGYGTYKSVRG